MPTDKKLIIAVVVLAVLGGAVFVQRQKESADLAAHSLESEAAKLPKLGVSDDDVKKIDKVELHRSPTKDTEKAEDIVLVKKGDEDWDLDKPVSAKANASSVKSMLDDLKRLEAKELIDAGKDNYAKYKLTDDKALHAVFYKGKDVVLDAYFGEDGSRGQMTRLGGKDGVYATKGYSSYVFNKGSSDWRDKTIFKFEEKDVVKVSLQNENGAFEFDKSGDDWKSKYGPKTASKDIENFDKTKLESLVRAFKGLTAADFGDDKKPDDVGLATPKETLVFELKDGTAKNEIDFGNTAEGSNRWAKRNGSDVLFTVSSWAGDWAVAKVDKFQKTDDKKAEKPGDKNGKDAKPAGLTLSNPAPTGE